MDDVLDKLREQHVPGGLMAQHPGMHLRDWFAGQALAGMLASGSAAFGGDWKAYAIDAYAMADAMLLERADDDTDQQ